MKAIALISGGLDSTLAARVMKEQGIDIVPVNFKIPFCRLDKRAAGNLGMEVKTIDISGDFLELLVNPRYGFGSNMNPCIDCKILMLKKAKELMNELGASFVVTGEVLAQRPMSQNRQALEIIEKRSGIEGLLLRPLCAKLMPETIPEKKGWVNRDKLLNFNGRQRSPQMELAAKFGIRDFPNPAGGCLLTDPEFTKRLKELIVHRELNADSIELLKLGRHFRISEDAKLVVGRNEKENQELAGLAKEDDYLFMPDEVTAGPTSLGRGIFSEDLIKLSCSITSRYCDLEGASSVNIIYKKNSGKEEGRLQSPPAADNGLKIYRI